MIERGPRGRFDLDQTLALSLPSHLQRAMVAQGIVARLAEQAESRPGAAGAADVGVIAGAAVAPQIIDGAVTVA